ncbi:hypothetical protein PG994_003530 [Apiospora phragmitis]|uniref:C2H2-type domain-containing protein n=1 Tax=Apiospora phragmitis TaxID=2905665 RepID=A0ABR1VYG4_9PEZI
MLRKWHNSIRQDSNKEHERSPWPLNCELCFQDLGEPFRSTAVQPSATYIPNRPYDDKAMGKAYVQWTMPLQLDTKTALDGNWTEKLKKAFSKAADTYDDLLCPHASFDDLPILHDFARHSDFRRRHTDAQLREWGLIWTSPSGELGLKDERDICKVCSSWLRPMGVAQPRKWEYLWVLGEHGLSLQRQLELPVPTGHQFSPAYEPWLQMMSPPSYGLPADTELRHITWCPDKQCANGKNWITHLQYLHTIAQHFKIRSDVESTGK